MKEVFLEILQNSQENTCARVSTVLKKSFPVNFAKFLRTPFLQITSRRLLLNLWQLTNLPLKILRSPIYWHTEIYWQRKPLKFETVEGLRKSEFKKLLFLATNDSHFIFNRTLHKQINGVAMSSILGPTLANAFLVYHKKMTRTLSTRM